MPTVTPVILIGIFVSLKKLKYMPLKENIATIVIVRLEIININRLLFVDQILNIKKLIVENINNKGKIHRTYNSFVDPMSKKITNDIELILKFQS